MSEETREGILSIDLKGTTIKTEERKGWLARIFLGKNIEVAQEAVTQMQYLENIYNVFKELGMQNILSLDVNGKTVYMDEENTDNDFGAAVALALDEESKEAYHIEAELDTTGDEVTNIYINMYGQHKDGDIPLVIDCIMEKSFDDMTKLLEDIKAKINEKFGIESGEIDVDEDEEDPAEDDPEEADAGNDEEVKDDEAKETPAEDEDEDDDEPKAE